MHYDIFGLIRSASFEFINLYLIFKAINRMYLWVQLGGYIHCLNKWRQGFRNLYAL